MYAHDIAEAIRGVRARVLSVIEFKERLQAVPAGVSSDIPCDILNMLYEEPANPSPDDLADLDGVLRRLEAGATYDEVLAHLRALWG